jgi:digeranylgeranylglycerophospholipid reductase
MPTRATKRGAQRTPLGARDCDVLVCGASFAGLALARELAGSGLRVLVVDRYLIGERQTSACAMPTLWMQALDLMGSLRQTFDSLLVHTRPAGASRTLSSRWPMPWSFSTFDYRELCALLFDQAGAGGTEFVEFETATVTGRTGLTVHTDRGGLSAPYIVDALGWRRVLSDGCDAEGHPIQPPDARLSRGLEVNPAGAGDELELWIDHRYVRSGYAWSFPAREEVRIGAGSFWPTHHVREPTVRLAGELGYEPDGYQGNWIPHQLRPAVQDNVFFVGDSAGHCLPLTAEGIRTALYFGLACARELRAAHTAHVAHGRHSGGGHGGRAIAANGSPAGEEAYARARAQALARYGAFSDRHARKYSWLLRVQQAMGQLTPTPAPSAVSRAMASRRFGHWAWRHYLDIAPPSFADAGPRGPRAAGCSRSPERSPRQIRVRTAA